MRPSSSSRAGGRDGLEPGRKRPRRGSGRRAASGSSASRSRRGAAAPPGRPRGRPGRRRAAAAARLRRAARARSRAAGSAPRGSASGSPVREGPLACERLVERHAEPPRVRRSADLAEARRVALLGRHVGVRSDRRLRTPRVLEAQRDAQVDQLRRRAHDDVARLDVEVRPAPAVHVVERRAELERQGEQLLDRDPVAPLEGREPRPVEELEHEMRALAVEHRVEAANERRVCEARERLGFPGDSRKGSPVRGPARPDDLDDDQRVQLVVPDEIGLIAPPPPSRRTAWRPGAIRSPSANPQVSSSQSSRALFEWYPGVMRRVLGKDERSLTFVSSSAEGRDASSDASPGSSSA